MVRDNAEEIGYMVRVFIRKGKNFLSLGLLRSKEKEQGARVFEDTTPAMLHRYGTIFTLKYVQQRVAFTPENLLFVYLICPEKCSNCYVKHCFLIW